MPEIMVTLSDALAIVRSACALGDGSEVALEARVRQLHRLGVPRQRRDKLHARFHYGLTEIAEIAFAVELMKAYMPPAAAARHVQERWVALAPVAVAGLEAELPTDFAKRHPPRAEPEAFVAGAALVHLGTRTVHGPRWDGPMGEVTDFSADRPWRTAGSGIVLDASVFMSAIYRELAKRPGVCAEDLLESVLRLRRSERASAPEGADVGD